MPTNPVARAISSVPAPDRADDATVIIAARFKKLLIDLVTNGVAVRDKMTGEQVIDADGKPAFRAPIASELSVINQFLARARAAGDINDHAEVQSILEEARARGWKFPEIDDAPDAASK